MKSLIIAGALVALPFAASAQNMTCADYLKMNKQMTAQMGGAASTGDAKMDAQAAAMDKKLNDYCAKNPTVKVDKAMEEAMK
ncbi:MAG TPA: hypothetical protein VHD14_11845 [Pseudolabrys sp.]|nr:hypothetical protein [Pseudolabrys sp.]